MKRITLTSAAVAAALLVAALASGAAAPQTVTHIFTCKDRNTSLSFNVTEFNGQLSSGRMYVENMQVASLTVKKESRSINVIKASVVGNSATSIAFRLIISESTVSVAKYEDPKKVVEVCKAEYRKV